jgi:hypothetical protein
LPPAELGSLAFEMEAARPAESGGAAAAAFATVAVEGFRLPGSDAAHSWRSSKGGSLGTAWRGSGASPPAELGSLAVETDEVQPAEPRRAAAAASTVVAAEGFCPPGSDAARSWRSSGAQKEDP